MALRSLAGKLRVSATAALQKASSPRVSSSAGSRLLTSRSSQNEEANRAMNGMKDLGKAHEEAMRDVEAACRAVDKLRKVSLLSAALGIIGAPCAAAYLYSGLLGSSERLI